MTISPASSLARGLPPAWARAGRRAMSRPRYWVQWGQGRMGALRHGDRYPHSTLYVAGLPKSGTSWLESMLASYPGYTAITPPEAVDFEYSARGSHRFQLPTDLFERLEGCLTVLKLHAEGSRHNRRLLHEARIPYVILFRDLRDVAVSHYHYVRRTPWHPEHREYVSFGVEEGLLHFAETLLVPFGDWVMEWLDGRDPELSMVLRYEELLEDTESTFREVAAHFGLGTDSAVVGSIVDAHAFERMSGGRNRGTEDENSFLRKGVSGDWRNHFTDEVKRSFQEKAGSVLDRLGYGESGSSAHGQVGVQSRRRTF